MSVRTRLEQAIRNTSVPGGLPMEEFLAEAEIEAIAERILAVLADGEREWICKSKTVGAPYRNVVRDAKQPPLTCRGHSGCGWRYLVALGEDTE